MSKNTAQALQALVRQTVFKQTTLSAMMLPFATAAKPAKMAFAPTRRTRYAMTAMPAPPIAAMRWQVA